MSDLVFETMAINTNVIRADGVDLDKLEVISLHVNTQVNVALSCMLGNISK